MMNAKYTHHPFGWLSLIALLMLFSVGCNSFEQARNTDLVQPISVTIVANTAIPDFDSASGAKVELINEYEQVAYTYPLTGHETKVSGVLPGIYSINISGETVGADGEVSYPNGSLLNYPLLEDGLRVELEVLNGRLSPLVFKEIYYCGSPKRYFRDQFYEIYNNSDEVCFLDGLYFCVLYPGTATTKLPIWPKEDVGKYLYTDRVWRFPGTGEEYPLKPGESCVISQFAANHQLSIYNPNSPIDGSSSEFEFNMFNKKFPDQPAYDMIHIFNDGKEAMGRVPQYLTPVFGGAYVLFKVPKGESYDPVNDLSLQAKDLSNKRNTIYAKIPVEYVLDGVEAVDNETKINAKRMPSFIDAGITYVGNTYIGRGVARKKVGQRPDGTPLLQDTNNSTNDFDRGVTPMLRRYGAKMPAWNHSLKNNN